MYGIASRVALETVGLFNRPACLWSGGQLQHAFKTADALACGAALNAVQFYTAHGYIG
jgi:hypothetical protein